MDLPSSVHDPAAVRDVADRILADRRYDRPPKSIPDRILEWFGEQLGKVFGSLVGSGAGTLVAWVLVAAAVTVVVVLVVRYGRVPAAPARGEPRAEVMVELTRSPTEWRAEAVSLEAQGRWSEALRCRHRALIGELVGRRAIADLPGRTAREHVRDVAVSLPSAEPALAAATRLFEDAWYGDVPTGAEESRRFQALESEVLDAAGLLTRGPRRSVRG